MKVALVVPCYNEVDYIDSVLCSVPSFVDWIIVVDDSSTDGTVFMVGRWSTKPGSRVKLIRHDSNQGVGASDVDGFRFALELGADCVAVVAGDGQMDLSTLHLLFDVIADGADYSKGNRFKFGFNGMPLVRRVGSFCLDVVTSCFARRWIRDSQNGYYAIRATLLASLYLGSLDSRYNVENDLLIRSARRGARIVDVPVVIRYGPPSDLKVLRFAVRTVSFFVMCAFWDLMGVWHV